MSVRAKGRTQRAENLPEFDPVAWRKSNVVFGRNGEILYPRDMPCPRCGLEVGADDDWITDHPFKPIPEDDEICGCGHHESHHRPHDCTKDQHEPIPCACVGGQPWFCCVNRHARQKQFLFQKIANLLAAAAAR